MKRRILSALMALAMVAGLMTGCSAPAAGDNSSSEGTSQAELAPVSKDEIKVGFVYISDSSDMGYTYNHELGTKEMQEALGLRDDQIISKYNVPEGAAVSYTHLDVYKRQAQNRTPAQEFRHRKKSPDSIRLSGDLGKSG